MTEENKKDHQADFEGFMIIPLRILSVVLVTFY